MNGERCLAACELGNKAVTTVDKMKSAFAAVASDLRHAKNALSKPFIMLLLSHVFGISADMCKFEFGGVTGLPLIVGVTVLPGLCPNYAAGAIAFMLACKHLDLTEMPKNKAGLDAVIAAAEKYHSWLVSSGPGHHDTGTKRHVNMDTKMMNGKGWKKTHTNLRVAITKLDDPFQATASAFFVDDHPTAERAREAIFDWAAANLGGESWRVFSQMLHWQMHFAPKSSHKELVDKQYFLRPVSASLLENYLISKGFNIKTLDDMWFLANLRNNMPAAHFAPLAAQGKKWKKSWQNMDKMNNADFQAKIEGLIAKIYAAEPKIVSCETTVTYR